MKKENSKLKKQYEEVVKRIAKQAEENNPKLGCQTNCIGCAGVN